MTKCVATAVMRISGSSGRSRDTVWSMAASSCFQRANLAHMPVVHVANLPAHPTDEITRATIDLWPPRPIPGLPAPKRLEACAVPSKNGLQLNDLRRTEQVRPKSGHQDQQRPITAA